MPKTVSTTWGELRIGHYLRDANLTLWKIVDARDGKFLMQSRLGEKRAVSVRPDETPVDRVELDPVDPVQLCREVLGAEVIAFKQNDSGVWTAAPWFDEKPHGERAEIYVEHLREMHGVDFPLADMEYWQIHKAHQEHHTPGVKHIVTHDHSGGRT